MGSREQYGASTEFAIGNVLVQGDETEILIRHCHGPALECIKDSEQTAFDRLNREIIINGLSHLPKITQETDTFLVENLIDVPAPGEVDGLIGHCVDDRLKVSRAFLESLPGFERVKDNLTGHVDGEKARVKVVGGAVGFVAFFGLFGVNMEDAVEMTMELYKHNGWGVPRIHNDFPSYTGNSAEELLCHLRGCGFVGVMPEAMCKIEELFANTNFPVRVKDGFKNSGIGEMIFQNLVSKGTKVVTVDGKHQFDIAKFVMIRDSERTIGRKTSFEKGRPILAANTGWLTRNTVHFVNEKLNTSLTEDQIETIWTILHTVAGQLIGAIRIDKGTGKFENMVVVKKLDEDAESVA